MLVIGHREAANAFLLGFGAFSLSVVGRWLEADVRGHSQVWQIPQTGEVFLSYGEYLDR